MTLAEPNFIDRNPQQIEADAIALYEGLVGKTLYPAQVEALLIDVMAYRENLVRVGIQEAAKQNLVEYATGLSLDHLGTLLDVVRLPASASLATIQFTKAAGYSGVGVVVPSGTQIGSINGLIIFETTVDLLIPPASTQGSVLAQAIEVGAIGNGFIAGQINQIITPIAGIAAASNTTTSNSGADTESDDRYRARIKLAPNKFSVAGSKGAYIYHALSADQTITDVAILNPLGTIVNVYPLTTTGLPSTEILNKVAATLSADKVRPLTDVVSVIAPSQINYTIAASVTLLNTADADEMQAALNAAAANYIADRKAGLGRDVIRSQIIAALSLEGVYSVTLTQPASDTVVAANQWANGTSYTVSIAGSNEG